MQEIAASASRLPQEIALEPTVPASQGLFPSVEENLDLHAAEALGLSQPENPAALALLREMGLEDLCIDTKSYVSLKEKIKKEDEEMEAVLAASQKRLQRYRSIQDNQKK